MASLPDVDRPTSPGSPSSPGSSGGFSSDNIDGTTLPGGSIGGTTLRGDSSNGSTLPGDSVDENALPIDSLSCPVLICEDLHLKHVTTDDSEEFLTSTYRLSDFPTTFPPVPSPSCPPEPIDDGEASHAITIGDRFYCPIDHTSFAKKGDFTRHQHEQHPETYPPEFVYPCPVPGCKYQDKPFVRKDKCAIHLKRGHRDLDLVPMPSRCRPATGVLPTPQLSDVEYSAAPQALFNLELDADTGTAVQSKLAHNRQQSTIRPVAVEIDFGADSLAQPRAYLTWGPIPSIEEDSRSQASDQPSDTFSPLGRFITESNLPIYLRGVSIPTDLGRIAPLQHQVPELNALVGPRPSRPWIRPPYSVFTGREKSSSRAKDHVRGEAELQRTAEAAQNAATRTGNTGGGQTPNQNGVTPVGGKNTQDEDSDTASARRPRRLPNDQRSSVGPNGQPSHRIQKRSSKTPNDVRRNRPAPPIAAGDSSLPHPFELTPASQQLNSMQPVSFQPMPLHSTIFQSIPFQPGSMPFQPGPMPGQMPFQQGPMPSPVQGPMSSPVQGPMPSPMHGQMPAPMQGQMPFHPNPMPYVYMTSTPVVNPNAHAPFQPQFSDTYYGQPAMENPGHSYDAAPYHSDALLDDFFGYRLQLPSADTNTFIPPNSDPFTIPPFVPGHSYAAAPYHPDALLDDFFGYGLQLPSRLPGNPACTNTFIPPNPNPFMIPPFVPDMPPVPPPPFRNGSSQIVVPNPISSSIPMTPQRSSNMAGSTPYLTGGGPTLPSTLEAPTPNAIEEEDTQQDDDADGGSWKSDASVFGHFDKAFSITGLSGFDTGYPELQGDGERDG